MKELISVIVPVYNVEDYLGKCIDSIINQTYYNLEIILIDDGSTDKSGIICDNYKKIDKRIKVVHQENAGLSNARNTGLDLANGSLISFVDSDDYLELSMLEELKHTMDITKSDISVCDFNRIIDGDKKNKNKQTNEIIILKNKDKYIYLQNEYNSIYPNAWNKLYKKELFDNIRYPDGKLFEDTYIICDLLSKAKVVSYLSKPLYNYVYRKESIMNNYSYNHLDQVIAHDKKILFYNKHRYYDLANQAKNKKMYIIIEKIVKMYYKGFEDKRIINELFNELQYTNNTIKWNEASKIVKRYKLFGNGYIRFRLIEYYIWFGLKNMVTKYTSF